jgi:hypothetical protein
MRPGRVGGVGAPGAGAGAGAGAGPYSYSSSSLGGGGGLAQAIGKAPRGDHVIEVRKLAVHFPFDPYPCQRIFIERLVEVLQRSENALLESPTGTGKVRTDPFTPPPPVLPTPSPSSPRPPVLPLVPHLTPSPFPTTPGADPLPAVRRARMAGEPRAPIGVGPGGRRAG